MQVIYLGRAPRTKETRPNFLKWRRVTRHPLVFHGLTGSQRTPGIGASHSGCSKFSKLSFIVKLLHLKVYNKWSNKSFDMLLDLLQQVLPNGGNLPKSHYKA